MPVIDDVDIVLSEGPDDVFEVTLLEAPLYGRVSLASEVPYANAELPGVDDVEGAIDAVLARRTEALTAHRMLDDGSDEPGAFVVFAADDGYTTQAGYFAALAARGVHGTLFLSPDFVNKPGNSPTFGDAYITSAQVAAIAAAGHELGTHGKNHETLDTYLAANGAAGLNTLMQQAKAAVEVFAGVGNVRTGSYPGGQVNPRTREVVGRTHEFFRSSQGVVSRNGVQPYNAPGIDCLGPAEATIKTYIDEAVANSSLVVLFWHGTIDAAQLTKVGNLITYCQGLGVPMGTFYEAMRQRVVVKSGPGAVDARGNAFFPRVRTNRVEVTRDDVLSDYAYFDIEEGSNIPHFDALGSTTWEFRKPLRTDQLEVGKRAIYADFSTTNGSPTVTSGSVGFTSADVGLTIAGAGIPGGATILAVTNATTATMSANATATAANVTVTLGRTAAPNFVASRDSAFYGQMTIAGRASGTRLLYIEPLVVRAATDSLISAVRSLREATNPGTLIGLLKYNGEFELGGVAGGVLRFRDEAGVHISGLKTGGRTWNAEGAGGAMLIDSGSGGSYLTLRGFGVKLLDYLGTNTVTFRCGTGSPEGAFAAPVGSLWLRVNGGAGTTLYVKETGTGNTGWVAK